jgi:hypothetical protein
MVTLSPASKPTPIMTSSAPPLGNTAAAKPPAEKYPVVMVVRPPSRP